jgi:hypothetical protein
MIWQDYSEDCFSSRRSIDRLLNVKWKSVERKSESGAFWPLNGNSDGRLLKAGLAVIDFTTYHNMKSVFSGVSKFMSWSWWRKEKSREVDEWPWSVVRSNVFAFRNRVQFQPRSTSFTRSPNSDSIAMMSQTISIGSVFQFRAHTVCPASILHRTRASDDPTLRRSQRHDRSSCKRASLLRNIYSRLKSRLEDLIYSRVIDFPARYTQELKPWFTTESHLPLESSAIHPDAWVQAQHFQSIFPPGTGKKQPIFM